MKSLISAGIVVYCADPEGQHEFLLLHYPHGHWDLPKGKIEEGESKEEAALRELKEETGITAELIDGFEESLSYGFKQNGELINKTVYFFLGTASSHDITLSHEHIGFAWLPYEQAYKRLTFENAKEVLKKAYNFLEHSKH